MVENSHTRGSLHELNEGQDGSDRVGNLVFMQSAPPLKSFTNQIEYTPCHPPKLVCTLSQHRKLLEKEFWPRSRIGWEYRDTPGDLRHIAWRGAR